jgi:hypothetical protein
MRKSTSCASLAPPSAAAGSRRLRRPRLPARRRARPAAGPACRRRRCRRHNPTLREKAAAAVQTRRWRWANPSWASQSACRSRRCRPGCPRPSTSLWPACPSCPSAPRPARRARSGTPHLPAVGTAGARARRPARCRLAAAQGIKSSQARQPRGRGRCHCPPRGSSSSLGAKELCQCPVGALRALTS